MNQHQMTGNLRITTISLLTRKLGTPSERRIQLAAYLLQEALDVPTGYIHRLQHHEPMSRDVEIALDRLKAMGYIRFQPGEHVGRIYTAIEPLPAGITRTAQPHIHTAKALAAQILDWTDLDLGAAVTVHFFRAKDPGKTTAQAACISSRMKPAIKPSRMAQLATELDRALATARNDRDRNDRDRPKTPCAQRSQLGTAVTA